MSSDYTRAPFPWFGGKSRAAAEVWSRFGADIVNYIEPFAGSLAVLLGRPGGPGKIETVNDLDCDIENFWRAVRWTPELVEHFADHPVNEAEMHARHEWLVATLEEHRALMHSNCFYYDAERAGWWVWGQCMWIGGGWCSSPKNKKIQKLDGIGKGVHSDRGHRASAHWKQRAHMSGSHGGMGVHSRREFSPGRPPDLTNAHGIHTQKQQLPNLGLAPRVTSSGVGVHKLHQKLPDLAVGGECGTTVGRGVHKLKQQIPLLRVDSSASGVGIHASGRNLPALGNDRGIHGVDAPPCLEWFLTLQRRLRRVRVACGDWKRVLGPSILGKGLNVGGRRPCAVFFDPPYSEELRSRGLYSSETQGVAAEVAEWCREHGDDPELRLALCGYKGEHEMPKNWSVYTRKGARGYSNKENQNRHKETIWFSPHCLKQGSLAHLWET